VHDRWIRIAFFVPGVLFAVTDRLHQGKGESR